MLALLDQDPVFAIDHTIAKAWWVKPFLRIARPRWSMLHCMVSELAGSYPSRSTIRFSVSTPCSSTMGFICSMRSSRFPSPPAGLAVAA